MTKSNQKKLNRIVALWHSALEREYQRELDNFLWFLEMGEIAKPFKRGEV